MAKTVSVTIRDVVIDEITAVSLYGSLGTPADLKVNVVAELHDNATGALISSETFEVTPSLGTLTALSNVMKNDILGDVNAAIAARAESGVDVDPVP